MLKQKKIVDAKWLAQGTIYPDRIESLSITGMVIKSHHNVGGLPKEMKLQLCEPLQWLFKDEVRRVGRQLQMPERLINRHPFPGPGLAVRILGDITVRKFAFFRMQTISTSRKCTTIYVKMEMLCTTRFGKQEQFSSQRYVV